ncbi:MAG: glycosyltransferase family 2 protein [Synechococcales bacterium]|nr:glycosyltransferase family 2 protein [Synechococcales bacterium]
MTLGLSGAEAGLGAIALLLLAAQLPAIALLLSRLFQGPGRLPPLTPQPPHPDLIGSVSVVVPTLNEAQRISPCLAGLTRQSYEVREITVVDSRSEDGTVDLVKAAQQRDPRFRVITDDPLPAGWVGRPWALHTGFLNSSEGSEWILGIDADTQPQPGLVASLVQAAQRYGYDLVSLSPQFILKDLGEWWLQPALLMTLVYRFGPAGGGPSGASRVMANGQCFLARRSLLQALDGYTVARRSFCDDVTLARAAADWGAKVGFLDGAKLLKVRMYEGAAETWQEWGRSLDLKDAASPAQTWGDGLFLVAVQGLPLIASLGLGLALLLGISAPTIWLAWGINLFLLLVRFALLGAIAPSYDFSQTSFRKSWTFWLSPLADPLAALRILLSAARTPTRWRSRSYTSFS